MGSDAFDEKEGSQKSRRVAEKAASYHTKSPSKAGKSIENLEKLMMQAAKNLEFEKAADYRDEIAILREQLFK